MTEGALGSGCSRGHFPSAELLPPYTPLHDVPGLQRSKSLDRRLSHGFDSLADDRCPRGVGITAWSTRMGKLGAINIVAYLNFESRVQPDDL